MRDPRGGGNALSWLYRCQYPVCGIALAIQSVIVVGNLVKGEWDLFVVFLTTACESIIIS